MEADTGALSIVGLGNCVVTASAAGDANYEAAAEVTSHGAGAQRGDAVGGAGDDRR